MKDLSQTQQIIIALMKKYLLSTIFSAIALATLNVSATSLSYKGPVTINWTVSVQETQYGLTHSSTNHSSKSTNIVRIYKATTKQIPANNASFLKLLSNSFNMSFPKGTQLVTDAQQLYVVDKTGSNVVLDITPVVTVQFQNRSWIYTSLETDTESITKADTKYSGNYSDSGANYVSLMYDDSAMATADGTHTTFHFDGMCNIQDSGSYSEIVGGASTGHEKTSLVFHGAGVGTVYDNNVVFGGSIIGSASGEGD